jgi:hypothetical protein
MTIKQAASTPAKMSRGAIVAGLCLVLAGWGVLDCFRTGYRQLSDLARATGPLHDAVIRKTEGKNAYYYLTFSVKNNPQTFGIRAKESAQLLTQLQQNMQQGLKLTVYYVSPNWWVNPVNFEVYQVVQDGSVIYSIEEVRQRALNHGAWGLVGWFILAVIMLWAFWQQRPSFTSES